MNTYQLTVILPINHKPIFTKMAHRLTDIGKITGLLLRNIRSSVGLGLDEKLEMFYSYNMIERTISDNDILVLITNKAIYKYENKTTYSTRRDEIKQVEHISNGLLHWDKISLTLHCGLVTMYGIYDSVSCIAFCQYLRSHPVWRMDGKEEIKVSAPIPVSVIAPTPASLPIPTPTPASLKKVRTPRKVKDPSTPKKVKSPKRSAGKPVKEYNNYVLLCEGNSYYVGRTSKESMARFEEHKEGKGAKWTREHKPIKLVETRRGSAFMEDAIVAEYMHRFPDATVRGGSYCKKELSDKDMEEIKRKIDTATFATTPERKVCERCGRNTHLADACYAVKHIDGRVIPKQVCARCGRDSHVASACYAAKDIAGNKIA